MGRARIKTGTSYFIVTSSGQLRRIRPGLIMLFAIVFISTITFITAQCFFYNQHLVKEKNQIQAQLTQLDLANSQLANELSSCERNKEKIRSLLYFKMDSEKVLDE